jgi:heterogeneous nuclear ribonucleoprotein F/H
MQGCEPVDILLCKRDGRFSGEAFVVLGSPLQIQMAVDKNKSYMGRRYVEVFRAKKLVSKMFGAAAAVHS